MAGWQGLRLPHGINWRPIGDSVYISGKKKKRKHPFLGTFSDVGGSKILPQTLREFVADPQRPRRDRRREDLWIPKEKRTKTPDREVRICQRT